LTGDQLLFCNCNIFFLFSLIPIGFTLLKLKKKHKLFLVVTNRSEISKRMKRCRHDGGSTEHARLLGLDKKNRVGRDELRRAYLRTALQSHPDKTRNASDNGVFQRVKEAYECLLLAAPPQPPLTSRGGVVKNDDHDGYVSGGQTRNICLIVRATLEEIFHGFARRVSFLRRGSGDDLVVCDFVVVQVEPGERAGTVHRFAECSHDVARGIKRGDVCVTLIEERHAVFTRDPRTNDLCVTQRISNPLAMAMFTVPRIDASVSTLPPYRVRVHPCLHPRICIPGGGMPVLQGQTHGRANLIVKLVVDVQPRQQASEKLLRE
jgi:hypothetical protein